MEDDELIEIFINIRLRKVLDHENDNIYVLYVCMGVVGYVRFLNAQTCRQRLFGRMKVLNKEKLHNNKIFHNVKQRFWQSYKYF